MTTAAKSGRETEVKLRVPRAGEMIARIRRLRGVVCDGRVMEGNTLYDSKDGDFRRAGYLFRVRAETGAASELVRRGRSGAVVTSKAPVPGSGTRRSRYKEKLERERRIRDPHVFEAGLRRIGLRPAFRYEKYRSTFRLGDLHICLDETPVGTFLELEGEPKAIDRAARALGYALKDYIRGTYWDVYAADCRRRGLKIGNMMFRKQEN